MKNLTSIGTPEICFNSFITKKALEFENSNWRDPKYLSVYVANLCDTYLIVACRTLIKLSQIYEKRDHIWDHIIVRPAHPSTPSYVDMAKIADVFFDRNEYAMQVIPRRKNYVNHEPYALHLWNLPDNTFQFYEIYQKLKSIPFKFRNELFIQFLLDTKENGALALIFEKNWPTWNEIVRIKEQILGTDIDAVIVNRSLFEDLSTINGHKVVVLWMNPKLRLPAKFLV